MEQVENEVPVSRRVRQSERPRLNVDGVVYYRIIKYKRLTYEVYKGPVYKGPVTYNSITLPPLLKKPYSQYIESRFTSDIPCHAQCVERAVANTHRVVKKRKTEESQLDCLLNTLKSRKETPRRVTKKGYYEDFLPSR